MKFQFNITITEKDYLDFNEFHALKSPYGIKTIVRLRIWLAIAFTLSVIYLAITQNWLFGVPISGVLLIFLVFLPRIFKHTLKTSINTMKKTGKMDYIPASTLTFYDDIISEVSETEKIERSYSVIERVCIITGQTLYLFSSNSRAFIIPIHAFESAEQYNAFLEFIKTKCSTINVY